MALAHFLLYLLSFGFPPLCLGRGCSRRFSASSRRAKQVFNLVSIIIQSLSLNLNELQFTNAMHFGKVLWNEKEDFVLIRLVSWKWFLQCTLFDLSTIYLPLSSFVTEETFFESTRYIYKEKYEWNSTILTIQRRDKSSTFFC